MKKVALWNKWRILVGRYAILGTIKSNQRWGFLNILGVDYPRPNDVSTPRIAHDKCALWVNPQTSNYRTESSGGIPGRYKDPASTVEFTEQLGCQRSAVRSAVPDTVEGFLQSRPIEC